MPSKTTAAKSGRIPSSKATEAGALKAAVWESISPCR